ncbi:hypothetical protein niasHT_034493 [Heterodera trifolii]|uniref:polynucleotide adenylyltransferase n=1 Tax=Heterodera trifolii TaxID=157864 RepID=A0ABD2HZI2_9BILA
MDQQGIDMLMLGTFINEIEHRIKMIKDIRKLEHLSGWHLDKNGTENAIENWKQMEWQIVNMKVENRSKFLNFEHQLYQILRNLLHLTDGESQRFDVKSEFEKQNLKKQMVLKNLLRAYNEDEEFKEKPFNMPKLKEILQFNMGEVLFEKKVGRWQGMMAQIEIDKDLFDKSQLARKDEHFLLPTFPLLSQQLFNAKRENVLMENIQIFENYFTTFLYGNKQKAEAFMRKIDGAINQIMEIVDKWSNQRAWLLVSGSLLLNSHTIGSDVNLVCLTPGEWLKVKDFMGTDKNAQCVQNKCTGEAANAAALFCKICENKHASGLVKIESESIMLIRFDFDGIPFDISLVTVPSMENLPMRITDDEVDKMLRKFNWSNSSDKKQMIRTLSSYRSTLYITNLFNGAITIKTDLGQIAYDQVNFRNMLKTLKIWATNNFIYSNKMGFLNGMTLALLVAKIVLLYPFASTAFLLEQFFLYYSTRLGRFPVQINKLDQTDVDSISSGAFSLLNLREFELPVLTPTVPAQNAARLVTHSNATTIRREMIGALKKIKSMKGKFDLAIFLNFVPFAQKYQTFIVINCMAQRKEDADEFCGFVEWKMRVQIIFDIDKKGGQIETHLYPNVYQENCILPNKFVKTAFSANHCKVWLLGTNSPVAKENLTGALKAFDKALKRQFYSRKAKSQNSESAEGFYEAQKIELNSVVAKGEAI